MKELPEPQTIMLYWLHRRPDNTKPYQIFGEISIPLMTMALRGPNETLAYHRYYFCHYPPRDSTNRQDNLEVMVEYGDPPIMV
jgi:hypothetical protein